MRSSGPTDSWGGFNLTQQEDFTFVVDGKLLVDERSGGIYFWATFLPKKLGPASAYPIGIRDGAGRLLSGQKHYRLHVPNDVPVRDFWSVIVYSMKTKSMIPNALDRAGLSSYDKSKLHVDADGSVDIHFGPNAPAGMESNWIPTGEDFFLLFRLYGPEEAFVNRTWKLPDIEEMK